MLYKFSLTKVLRTIGTQRSDATARVLATEMLQRRGSGPVLSRQAQLHVRPLLGNLELDLNSQILTQVKYAKMRDTLSEYFAVAKAVAQLVERAAN